ncbi:MAG TPA: branched-chain amino acid ABC transporter permease [bacterium]|nr:branched-chain amino acid ABC transporter permease [bacterium]
MGRWNRVSLVVLAGVAGAMPFLLGTDSYYISVLVMAGIRSIVAIGLSLLMGYAGQISLGHGALFGLGAYSSGLLTTLHPQSGWLAGILPLSPWTALVVAAVMTAAIAYAIGTPCLRLRGHYLAMATLAFGEIVVIFFVAMVDLTGGPSGFGGIPDLPYVGSFPAWLIDPEGGYNLFVYRDTHYYFLVWIVVILTLIFSLNLIHSRVGRALRSIHGSELAASTMGVNTAKYKVQVFVLSAIFASVAGSLYAHFVTFVSPTACELKYSILLLTMVAVGGMANVWGAVLGAVLLTLLPEYLRAFEDYDVLVYGGILIGILMFMPQGLLAGCIQLIGKIKPVRKTTG